MNIAVIPARGGSKRIPLKNIKPFCGKPMIAWSIEAAKASDIFDLIIVSTDDTEIRETAITFGAEVPFLRPPELADDHTPTIPVIRHSVNWLTQHYSSIKNICCVYATAPFLKSSYLKDGYVLLKADLATQYVMSVTHFKFPIFRALKLGKNNETEMFWEKHAITRSQDLPEAYHDAGQFYWGTSNTWQTCDQFFTNKSKAIKLPSHRVQDIDTAEDWIRAELMFKTLQNEN